MSSLPTPGPTPDPLVVRTVPVTVDPGPLLSLVPEHQSLAWLRRGEGFVGWGESARIETSGPGRFADAQAAWDRVCASAVVRDEVDVPGTGLVAFGSFAFADEPGASVLVVPEVVVGHRAGTWWVTTISRAALSGPPDLAPESLPRPPEELVFHDGALSGAEWELAVAEAVRRIGDRELEKVVLARDLIVTATEDIDVRWPLHQLAVRYRSCWTFHVAGLFGATPEMLVRRERGLVTSRVLAGTIRRTGDDQHDLALAGSLARSSKDLEEHEFAVRSVAGSLAPYCSSMNVPETPFVMHLPNVMHLATDVTGVVGEQGQGITALDLAAALHPTAAVGGTPTDEAVKLIAEIERMPRGRYAGPVGWIDEHGDGEWGIALRCAEIAGSQARLFAGCGIVASSDPEVELAESQAKLVPVRDALEP